MNFLHPAKPGSPRPSRLADVGEGPLDERTSLALQLFATLSVHAPPIGVHRGLLLGRLIGPAAVVFQLRLRNVGAIGRMLGHRRQLLRRVIALVGGDILDLGTGFRFTQIRLRVIDAVLQRLRIGVITRINLGCQNRIPLQITMCSAL